MKLYDLPPRRGYTVQTTEEVCEQIYKAIYVHSTTSITLHWASFSFPMTASRLTSYKGTISVQSLNW